MPHWLVIILAGAIMFGRDGIATLLTIANAKGALVAAAAFSVVLELASVLSYGIGAFLAIEAWDTDKLYAVLIVGSLCAGSALASVVGGIIGKHFIDRPLPAEH